VADDPRSTAGKIGTILSVVELALADTPQPERAVDILEFVIERLSSRLVPLKVKIAEDLRRERRKTPPPRRISQTMPNATAPTERHDMRPLVEESEARREFEERDTPATFEPAAVHNTHPAREK